MQINRFFSLPQARSFLQPATAQSAHGPVTRALGILGLTLLLGTSAQAQTILGTTGDYAVMAGSTVTINGTTTITGDLGRASLAGAGSLTLNGAQGIMTGQDQTDFTRAFSGLAAMTPTTDLTGSVLGSGGTVTILTPGIYNFDATAQLTGTLTLDAQNQTNAVWVFQIGTTFTTAASSSVVFTNLAANSVATNGLFWQVGTTTSIGAGTTFEGNILGGTTFDFGASATINHGRALTGAGGTITLAGNTFDFIAANSGYSGGLAFAGAGNTIVAAVPEPSTYALLAGMMTLAMVVVRRRSFRAAARA